MPKDPCPADMHLPLYLIEPNAEQFRSPSSLLLQIHRVDDLPALNRFGEKLRADRENWLTFPQAMARLSEIIGKLPQYQTISKEEADDEENLRRFNEEFGYEVAPANRRVS